MRPALYDSSLVKNGCGYVLLPIRLPEAWQLYKSAQAAFWTAEDVLYQPLLANHAANATLAARLCSIVAAVRAAALPENMSMLIHDPELACFLSFQAMQENIQLETVASLALATADVTGSVVTPLGWPKPCPPYAENDPGLITLLEHAAIYATVKANIEALAPDCIGDTILTDAVKRIAQDYGRSYAFSIILCAIVCGGPETDKPTFLDAARGVVELVTSESEISAPMKLSVCEDFVDDLRTALDTIPYRDTKRPVDGVADRGGAAEKHAHQPTFSTNESF